MFLRLLKEFKKNRVTYYFFISLVLTAFFLRTYRIDQLLYFNYDQGRDALVIKKILEGDIVLIGPTTGIEGLFLGPFYYYFLAIGYFLGMGNPVVASYWQTVWVVLGIVILFILTKKYLSVFSAFFISILLTFSFHWTLENRWLSSPSLAAFFTPLGVLFLTLSFKNVYPYLPLAFLVLGIILQLEAATGFFIILLTFVLIIFNIRLFTLKYLVLSFLAFFLTLVPQIIFEFKNNFLMSRNLFNFILGTGTEGSGHTFQIPTERVIGERISLFGDIFLERVSVGLSDSLPLVFVIYMLFSLYICFKYWQKPLIKISNTWFWGTLFIFLFYSGNYGLLYSWYFIPLTPLFFLLLTFIAYECYKYKIFLAIFLIWFLSSQYIPLKNYLTSGVDGETTIALGNQVQAVKFVYEDSGNDLFNVDVYLPPVIPYPYTYLFDYYSGFYEKKPAENLVKRLYTVHENDVGLKRRETEWLKRQEGIGKIVKEVRFGGITVEKRERINIDDK